MEGAKNRQIDGALTTLGDLPFLVAAAHELKAPLALMRQLSIGLEQGLYEEDERQRILRKIILTSERSLRLTSDLTRAVRLEDSLFELEPLNSRQLCEEVAHELSPLFAARQKSIQVESSSRNLLVVGNRKLLQQILINFSDNALHYTKENTPVIIQASRCNKDATVKFGVRDYGPAIPIDIWKKVHRHLGKSPQLLHDRPSSSGLGLYIASQFAAAMHGSIGAIRHRDGATFYVNVPISRQLELL